MGPGQGGVQKNFAKSSVSKSKNRRIQNPVEYLGWSFFFAKIVNGFQQLIIFTKKAPSQILIGSSKYASGKLANVLKAFSGVEILALQVLTSGTLSCCLQYLNPVP